MLPYLAVQKVYIVPVMRNRLNFCVLFRQAFEELKLGPRDLIAVEVPAHIKDAYLECVADLPKVSVVHTAGDDGKTREIFTITPCDAVAEATRTARENGIDVAFIDRTLSPSALEGRQCVDNPAWPDDGFALIKGIEWYIAQVDELLAVPPARSDPVDEWRESYMAGQIQELAPWYDRIMVVCDLVHARPLMAQLQQPPDSQLLDDDRTDNLRVRRLRPSLSHLLQSLDDIPRLVEAYDHKRHVALNFWKMREIVAIVHHLAKSSPDMAFSVRNYDAFTSLLTKMGECQGRLSPTLDDVRLAGVSCFNDAFGERIFRHLLGYFDDLKVGRVKTVARPLDTESRFYELQVAPSAAPEYVARNCNPWITEYEIQSEPRPPEDYPRGGTHSEVAWPPCDRFADEMRRKAHRVLTTATVQTTSIRFRGSIESGVDVRRTMRSQLLQRSPDLDTPRSGPEIYVRKIERTVSDGYEWLREPTAWILDTPADIDTFRFTYGTGGDKGEKFALDWRFSQERRSVSHSDDLKVEYESTPGYLAFMDLTTTGRQARAAFGADFGRRTPVVSSFRNVAIGNRWELAPRALDDVEFEIESWWEALILAGLIYCEARLVCVAPADLRIPNRVLHYANSHRKSIHRVPLGAFDRDEQRKLSHLYWVDGVWKPPRDSNDPKFHEFLIRKYGDQMTRSWG
ncbi:hypothetical protein ACFVYA_48840 [Amycolatopsis sp. NPDC058278]|uniref:hypothetical protein n=1 Tax=Amycolatopsis sp. NPDC058278 TaxID=3346417 RepID=UPI0036DCFAB1